LAKWFCGHGFAWAVNAAPSFFSAHTAIAASAIAASPAASMPESVSGVAPTGDTNGVRKDASIIATGSDSTVNAGRKRA
jgi:hypothetical protein